MKQKEEKINLSTSSGQVARPPIIVVMGHVDHGKTTLLDNIKKTNIAAKEAGGITQSIGAYEIEWPPKEDTKSRAKRGISGEEILRVAQDDFAQKARKITFIDTPGHEAFSKMRQRGAHVADLAILIVAADDGLQPQTKESIEILNDTKTPYVVAVNKIDKPNADVEKTINDLMQAGVFLEGRGGNVSWQKISAKLGQGVDELLDLVLLASEMESLTYNPQVSASGIIIEAKMDSRRGITAVGIIKNGTLKSGDYIGTATACGKIKLLENFIGERADKLEPSAPALILGFESLPQIGEEFIAGEIEPSPIEKTGIAIRQKAEILVKENGKPTLNLFIKADVSGSLEALSEIIRNLSQENVGINILEESVGEITDGDVKRAAPNGVTIIGFNVKTSKAADNLSNALKVKIIASKIIYELVRSIELEMKDIENPPPLGELEVLALFSQKNKKQLVGGKVISGMLKNKIEIKIIRNGEELGIGRITNLKSHKQEVTQIIAPNECGVMIESSIAIEVGDHIIYPHP